MQNDHVVGIVNDAVAREVEFANNMDVGAPCGSCLVPGLSELNNKAPPRPFVLDGEQLLWSSLAATGTLIVVLIDIKDKISFDCSIIG
jgi:hypothetical protein